MGDSVGMWEYIDSLKAENQRLREGFEDAKQHLFWLKENTQKDAQYNARIAGYKECLLAWNQALASTEGGME